ncbi:MAG: site-specific integrase [Nodosilinea sp.]
MSTEKNDAAIAQTNAELKAARCRLRIERRHDRLVLRGMFPPKPESDRDKPFTQRLSIGLVYATPAGLRAARKQALLVSEQLNEGLFAWADWLEDKAGTQTIAGWAAEFEADYFKRRGRNPKVETTWDKDYSIPFGRLPQDVPLSAEVLSGAIALTAPNTRARQRYCTAYSALAKFAGLEVDLLHLRGSYSPAAVNPRELPSDALVLEWDAKIPDPQWQTFYRLMAVYGLRNHECWYVDLARLATEEIALVRDGKTGGRLVVPYPVRWWESWFKGGSLSLPVLTVRRNADYGRLSAQYFNRLGLPFTLYNLRHTHAARMAAGGVDGQLAAKMQGHSAKVHERIYLNFMDERHYQALVDRQREPEP